MIDISVIVPVYNVENYICECIKSILNQTLKNIEILVIDDGSKDNSINIVKEFNDERIKIITKENGGLSSARNEGIRNSSGKYIFMIDSDDFLMYDTALEEMLNLIKQTKSDIVVGNANIYYSKKQQSPLYRAKEVFFSRVMNSDEFLIEFLQSKSMHMPVWLNLYKSELIKGKIEFKEGRLHEDEEFTPRLFLKAHKIAIYPKEFYAYRQRENSITTKKDKTKNSQDLIITCLEHEKIYNSIENESLRKILLDNLTDLFLYACEISKLKEVPAESYKFLKSNSCRMNNKIKTYIFMLNKKLYYKLRKC